jgi:hypothetical protein
VLPLQEKVVIENFYILADWAKRFATSITTLLSIGRFFGHIGQLFMALGNI